MQFLHGYHCNFAKVVMQFLQRLFVNLCSFCRGFRRILLGPMQFLHRFLSERFPRFPTSDPMIQRRLLRLDHPYLTVAYDTLIGGERLKVSQLRSIMLEPIGLDAIRFGTQRVVGIKFQNEACQPHFFDGGINGVRTLEWRAMIVALPIGLFASVHELVQRERYPALLPSCRVTQEVVDDRLPRAADAFLRQGVKEGIGEFGK